MNLEFTGMALNLSKSFVDLIVFELKFEEGYSYWDNCGKIWSRISQIYKNKVTLESANTTKGIINFDDKDLVVAEFGPEKITFTHQDPVIDRMKIGEISSKTLPIFCELMEINSYSRIGNRFHFIFPADDINDIRNFISSLATKQLDVSFTDHLFQDVSETCKNSVSFRIENKEIGYHFALEGIRKFIKVRFPTCFMDTGQISGVEQILHKENPFLRFDIDCYWKNSIDVKEINPSEMIEANFNRLNKVLKNLMTKG